MQPKHNHFPNNLTTATNPSNPPPPPCRDSVPRPIERTETRKKGIAKRGVVGWWWWGVPLFQTRTQAYPSSPFLYFLT